MNGRQAKRLRSVGDAMYTMEPDNRKAQLYKVGVREVVVGWNADGTPKRMGKPFGILFNNKQTARAIYQKAKARFKKMRRAGVTSDVAHFVCGTFARNETAALSK